VRASAAAAKPSSPEELLSRAMDAKTPRSRGVWARRGLASRARLERTTHAMLLRQLYLSHFEQRGFKRALEVAEQSIELGVLPDVLHQDAARAAAALGDVEVAARHLRLAARLGPPSRRAFHWWTLGSLYFLASRHGEAIGAFERAARWGTRDKPLYHGHLAITRAAAGEPVEDLDEVIERLASVPAGQGYGRFVLGLLAFHARRFEDARDYLETFVARMTRGRPATTIALDAELERARQVLATLSRRRRP
jgi:tetratricopeptide (TPR) repeat protein